MVANFKSRCIKKKFLKFRGTSLEKSLIKKKVANTGLSMSEFSRAAVLV
ncbi:plasmid mobilization protein [Tenacibaculum maritimum]